VHLGEDRDFAEMYRKEIWRGQSNLQSIKGRKIPLREIPSFVVPIGIFAMLLVCIATLLSGFPLLAFISFSLFLAPVMAYSIRLYKLVRNRARLSDVIKFYLYYFPARAIGTLGGIFKNFSTSSHNS
jgi:uncharacterized membrane protein